MPEAVASNSRPVPERQPFGQLPDYVQDEFDDLQSMLKAFNEMALCVLDSDSATDDISHGMNEIHRLIMRELDSWAGHAQIAIEQLSQAGNFDPKKDDDLLHRVGDIVAAVFCDAGWSMSKDDMAAWGVEETRAYSSATAKYYRLLLDKLEGDTSRITAGSWLPWLEMKIRKDMGVIPEESATDLLAPSQPVASVAPKILRDQIIAEKHREGRTPAEISQALSLRQSTVLRTIDRLTGRQEGGERKAG